MKTTIYKCENCAQETISPKLDGWLEIASKGGTLEVNNHFVNRKLISMNNHGDIHYCSSKCFIEHFIK